MKGIKKFCSAYSNYLGILLGSVIQVILIKICLFVVFSETLVNNLFVFDSLLAIAVILAMGGFLVALVRSGMVEQNAEWQWLSPNLFSGVLLGALLPSVAFLSFQFFWYQL